MNWPDKSLIYKNRASEASFFMILLEQLKHCWEEKVNDTPPPHTHYKPHGNSYDPPPPP